MFLVYGRKQSWYAGYENPRYLIGYASDLDSLNNMFRFCAEKSKSNIRTYQQTVVVLENGTTLVSQHVPEMNLGSKGYKIFDKSVLCL